MTAFFVLIGGLASQSELLSVDDILKLPNPPADHRVAYGDDPLQFGDLRLPEGEAPHPVAIVIHGGCWRSQYTLDHVGSFSEALRKAGLATWTIEYRRVGDPGGGWPGTFQDVAAAVDHLRELAPEHGLDLERVVAAGHSAGGHLALWAAARSELPATSPIRRDQPLHLAGAVSLAGVADLRRALAEDVCGGVPAELLGGTPAEHPDRYRQGSPVELLPLGVPVRLVHGERDEIVPADFARDFEARARAAGDDVRLTVLDEAGHFELIAPAAGAWSTVLGAIQDLAGR